MEEMDLITVKRGDDEAVIRKEWLEDWKAEGWSEPTEAPRRGRPPAQPTADKAEE